MSRTCGGLAHGPDEVLGSAHVDVRGLHVGDQVEQGAGVDGVVAAVADQVAHADVRSRRGDLVELGPQDERLRPRGAEEDVGPDGRREVVQHRADRRHADAAGEQDDALTVSRVGREDAVRPLRDDARARAQPGERAAVVAEVLHGDAQVARVGAGRERVRVRLPPHLRGEEPPAEELAAADVERREVATLDPHAHGVLRLADDGVHAQVVPPRAHEREPDPEEQERAEGHDVEAHPDPAGPGVGDELLAVQDLVHVGEGDREVEVEVGDPPGLVLHPASRHPPRRDARPSP